MRRRPDVIGPLPRVALGRTALDAIEHSGEPLGTAVQEGPCVDIRGITQVAQSRIHRRAAADRGRSFPRIQIAEQDVRVDAPGSLQKRHRLHRLPAVARHQRGVILLHRRGSHTLRIPMGREDVDGLRAAGIEADWNPNDPHGVARADVQGRVELDPLLRAGKSMPRQERDTIALAAVRLPSQRLAKR